MYLQNKFLKKICPVWSGLEKFVLVINTDTVREFRGGLFKLVLSRDFLHLHKKNVYSDRLVLVEVIIQQCGRHHKVCQINSNAADTNNT